MQLDGIHHISAITGDARRNLDFYTRVLGLRLVKKTVNQDDPTVYHLFYADEAGDPGSDLTFFEYPGAGRGRHGAGMVHTIVWRVGSQEALDFWAARVPGAERVDGVVRFEDPEGIGHELVVSQVPDEPLIAEHPEIPAELALQGFDGVRAYARDPERSRTLLEQGLAMEQRDERTWEARGVTRGGWIRYEEPPAGPGIPGGGTVHHVAWSVGMDEQERWREQVARAGARPTPVIDRLWFRSVYFREPSGVLFELATRGPGFATDEDPEHLGEKLILPPAFEHLRAEVEPILTPLPDPRESWTRS